MLLNKLEAEIASWSCIEWSLILVFDFDNEQLHLLQY